MILDGGPAEHGVESTVIAVSGGELALLRPGAITAHDIERIAGRAVIRPPTDAQRPSSPGQLLSHYAPAARLRLDAKEARAGEALLAFGRAVPSKGFVINLSPSGSLTEAAANLFASLRAFDAAGSAAVAVMSIPETGVGVAINDRLRRAAAPRP
jgi:L-threonylcarbamoyladenylate synthase